MEEPLVYLRVEGGIVGYGTEAEMVSLAALHDADYEIIQEEMADLVEVREFLDGEAD